MTSEPFVVVVDGVIGSGKTVLIDAFYSQLSARGWRITIVKEPVDKWKESGLLQRFYKDPKRWGYHFQTKAFHDRVVENIKMFEHSGKETDIFILERSPFTDTLFMEILYDSGDVDDLEMSDYREWWRLWYKVMPYQPNLFIYLKPDLDVCMQRLRERNRDGEQGVSRDYQERLKAKHDQFFAGDSVRISEDTQVPILKIETNENFRDDPQVKKRMATILISVIQKHKKKSLEVRRPLVPSRLPSSIQAELDEGYAPIHYAHSLVPNHDVVRTHLGFSKYF